MTFSHVVEAIEILPTDEKREIQRKSDLVLLLSPAHLLTYSPTPLLP
jgi:hypothetical protein